MGRAFEYRKATKFARWDRMAKAFTKCSKEITVAVKTGGDNPDSNLALRRALQNAKGVQMPKDKITAAIKRASSKDISDFKEIVYEGMAPHGIATVVECVTDNPTRTVANIRAIFRRKEGELGTQGMHDFLFNRKGVFLIPVNQISDQSETELTLIDFGLESMGKNEENTHFEIITNFNDFGLMQEGLEKLGIEAEKSELQRIPTLQKKLNEEDLDQVLALIDTLEQDEDVQNVFHNLE